MGEVLAKGQTMADPIKTPLVSDWFASCTARANTVLVALDDHQVGPAGALARQSLRIWHAHAGAGPHPVVLSSVPGLKAKSDQTSVQMPLMYEVPSPAKE